MAFEVTTADIESRWRPLSDDESDVAFIRLQSAQNKLLIARPTLETRYAALPVSNATQTAAKARVLRAVVDCLCEAVIAYLRNPDRLRQQTLGATGDVGIGFEVDGSSGIILSDGDLADIDAALATAEGAAQPKVVSRRLVSSFPYYQGDETVLPTP